VARAPDNGLARNKLNGATLVRTLGSERSDLLTPVLKNQNAIRTGANDGKKSALELL
jgi:hypothetical protein